MGQGSYYWEMVLPGMLVGALTGYVSQRYPPLVLPDRAAKILLCALLTVTFSSIGARINAQSAAPADALAPVARLVGR